MVDHNAFLCNSNRGPIVSFVIGARLECGYKPTPAHMEGHVGNGIKIRNNILTLLFLKNHNQKIKVYYLINYAIII